MNETAQTEIEQDKKPKIEPLWKVEDVATYFGVSTSHTYKTIVCQPKFPRPIKLSGVSNRYVPDEVIEFAKGMRG